MPPEEKAFTGPTLFDTELKYLPLGEHYDLHQEDGCDVDDEADSKCVLKTITLNR